MSAGLLQSILARLDRLEQLYSSPAGETLSPSYLTIDPETGLVSANFSGVVSADGLTMPANDGTLPITQSTIAWDQGTTTYAAIQGFTTPILLLRALAADGASGAAIQMNGSDTNAQITVDAGASDTLTLIDTDNQSSFLKIPTLQNLTVVGGRQDLGAWNGASNPMVFAITVSGLSAITYGIVNLDWGTSGVSGSYCPILVAYDYSTPSAPEIALFNPPGTPSAGIDVTVEYLFVGPS